MLIQNAFVLQNDFHFHQTNLQLQNGLITDISDTVCPLPPSEPVLNATGCYVVPGLIDLHFHGCNGYDFCDGTPEALDAIAEYEVKHGITSICPATMTLPGSRLEAVFSSVHYTQKKNRAAFLGINMEGPYLSAQKKGAQDERYLVPPDWKQFERMQSLSGHRIKLLTLAPELPGAMEFIKKASPDVTVSLGHSMADYQTACRAFENGASHVTHLYNAMLPFSHREPGILGAALDSGASVELIPDGVHIHPSVIRATFQMFGAKRILFISDSMMAAGLSDGTYQLGGQSVAVKGKYAALTDGTIAGSNSNLFDCVKSAISMGIPACDAFRCASYNPAVKLGVSSQYGSIEKGHYADLLLLDKNWNLVSVLKHGIICPID